MTFAQKLDAKLKEVMKTRVQDKGHLEDLCDLLNTHGDLVVAQIETCSQEYGDIMKEAAMTFMNFSAQVISSDELSNTHKYTLMEEALQIITSFLLDAEAKQEAVEEEGAEDNA